MHVLCGISTHDPGFRTSEDSTYLRPLGYRDWLIKHYVMNIVAYLLKAKTVEPEKQPLLANGSETIFVSRQRPQNK
jgi:hypothetical protein